MTIPALRATALALLVLSGSIPARAVTLTFEGVTTTAETVVNVNPSEPYTEAGFLFTPVNDQSAVFAADASTTLPGVTSAWFGFAESNPVTVTHNAGLTFDFSRFVAGASTLASGPLTLTVTGIRSDGTTLTETFENVSAAGSRDFNWTGLASLRFESSDDAGLDDLALTPVPEPETWMTLAIGLAGVAGAVTRRRCAARMARRH